MLLQWKMLRRRLGIGLLVLPALIVTLLSLAALTSGMTSAAAASQPGDLLYPARVSALELQLALAADPAERAEIQRDLQAAILTATAEARAAVASMTVAPTATTAVGQALPALTVTADDSVQSNSTSAPEDEGAASTADDHGTSGGPRASHTPAPGQLDDDTATGTPSSKPSNTPHPTNTARPSETADPSVTAEPTRTPEPTRTAEPSHTPEPTRTTEPTRTPEPSRTPEPTRTTEPTRTAEPSRTPEPEAIDWEGTLQSQSGATWMIAGQAVQVTSDTDVRDNPSLGDTVRVQAWRYPDGTVRALRIEIR